MVHVVLLFMNDVGVDVIYYTISAYLLYRWWWFDSNMSLKKPFVSTKTCFTCSSVLLDCLLHYVDSAGVPDWSFFGKDENFLKIVHIFEGRCTSDWHL